MTMNEAKIKSRSGKQATERAECKAAGCRRKGYWVEAPAGGEAVICFPMRHDGENHVQKFTLSDIAREFAEARG